MSENEYIIEKIKETEEIVNNSEVNIDFYESAFGVVLGHLLNSGQNQSKLSSNNAMGGVNVVNDDTDVHKEFIKKKHPKNIYQRIACDVYYHTEKLGNSHITKKEIIQYVRDYPGDTTIKNTTYLDSAIKATRSNPQYGYIEYIKTKSKNSKENMQLSIMGKQIVERLPEQNGK
ncbi:MAG: hypothetical protein F4X82_03555 [Candidatus Spechtbacteria bacterium SB0662_bin_43]|uniref:Uncharacterized protein n=1 Tax=Candidatus Spechtbacteria bacterium SB0662_bin_43 TaxID=2604897 RepID=A0A845DD27_9BACT|nr:hypothetical protein [Candidatus Spechtbacteria bacterium SB0662_bin_43]